jgi:hypothetical protein
MVGKIELIFSKQDEGQFKKHYLIGLFIKEKHDFDSNKTESGLIKTGTDIKDIDSIKDKAGRRRGSDRRKLANTGYVEERRSGQDRRSGLDRRSERNF